MNKKIKALAIEAGLYVDFNGEPWPKNMTGEDIEGAYEKFALLLIDECAKKVEAIIDEEFREVTPKEVGLDTRAGYNLFINEDYIAVSKGNRRTLDYYGGFEYVDEEHVTVLGDMVFYSADDERVQDHLNEFFMKEDAE
jgi:hypothetical protein